MPSISGAPGCGPGLVRGTRLPACRICCLFTISNIRATHRKKGRARIALTSGSKKWWSLSGSNRRPEACKATALPAELRPLGEAKGLDLASNAGGNVRSLGCPAHQRGRPFGLATLRVGPAPPSCEGRPAAGDVSPGPKTRWWAWDDSNVRPHPYQGCALTT